MGHVDPAIASIVMAGVIALVWGGVQVLRRGDRQKGMLMLVAALVVFGNLLIWTL